MHVPQVDLVLGGARSGKSRFAQGLARSLTDAPVYLATSRRWDDDHAARIARHRRERGPEWTTVEETRHPSRCDLAGRVVVLDCLTLWLTNVFANCDHDPDRTIAEARAEMARTCALPNHWILVSNEIGCGVHGASEAARKFTDLQGWLNQDVAAQAHRVTLMVAGLPVVVKEGAK